jgi:tRNA(fMet)-specific endonuclease VapC
VVLLDTDTCIHLLNGTVSSDRVERMRRLPASEIGTAAITAAELRYGALHSGRPDANLERTEVFLAALVLVPFENVAASHFARIKQQLVRRGRPIGVMDMLIAATALAARATLVSGNLREFSRVPGLAVESWTTGKGRR